jgi:hypothetical protein
MATTVIDGIATQYEVVGSGPPLLMFSPGGFDATLDKWITLGIYAKIKILGHLSRYVQKLDSCCLPVVVVQHSTEPSARPNSSHLGSC